jgi:hypothetical protein
MPAKTVVIDRFSGTRVRLQWEADNRGTRGGALMKSFAEFLKEKEEEVRSAEAARAGEINRWITAVHELMMQVQSWLEDSDQSKLLKFRSKAIEINETESGSYGIGRLEIWLGGRVVALVPIARYVRGPVITPQEGSWTGRVDLTDGENKYEIFRFTRSDGNESWYMRTDNYHVRPFNRDLLEQSVMTLLS